MYTKEVSKKTEGWSENRREWELDVLCEKMKEFKDNYKYLGRMSNVNKTEQIQKHK